MAPTMAACLGPLGPIAIFSNMTRVNSFHVTSFTSLPMLSAKQEFYEYHF